MNFIQIQMDTCTKREAHQMSFIILLIFDECQESVRFVKERKIFVCLIDLYAEPKLKAECSPQPSRCCFSFCFCQ